MELLLCEEEISWSPCRRHCPYDEDEDQLSSTISSSDCASNCSLNHFAPPCAPIDDSEIDHLLVKELDYMPEKHYLAGLQFNNLCQARSKSIQWLVEAQSNFNFSTTTIALAINYFDRYLAKNLSKVWTTWMFELLSTACLSTAAKMEEILVPQLIDLQVGAIKHAFDSSTVQRMELLVLNTLEWKLRSITPFSFVDLAMCGLKLSENLQQMLYIRISELVFGALSEGEFVEFCPSVLAATALYFALEEMAPSQLTNFKSIVAKEIFQNNQDKFSCCYKLMEELVVDPIAPSPPNCVGQSTPLPLSPVISVHETVDLAQKSDDNCGSITGYFLESVFHSSSNYLCVCAYSNASKKRKRGNDMD